MGYSQLFAQGWSWGNLLAEGVAGFVFALLLIVGYRLIENSSATFFTKRALLGLTVLVVVLISSLTSLGISELYRKSSGAPILTPIFGLFYGFIFGSYTTVGTIIAAQIIGSLVGFLLAIALRPRLKSHFKKETDSSVRGFFWRGLAIIFLLVGIGVISLVNPTSYGGTAVLKIVIMALVLGGFVAVFGSAEFYTYTSFYQWLVPNLISVKLNATVETASLEPSSSVQKTVKRYGGLTIVYGKGQTREFLLGVRTSMLGNAHLQALLFQFAALGIMIGVYALVQIFPGALSISNVI